MNKKIIITIGIFLVIILGVVGFIFLLPLLRPQAKATITNIRLSENVFIGRRVLVTFTAANQTETRIEQEIPVLLDGELVHTFKIVLQPRETREFSYNVWDAKEVGEFIITFADQEFSITVGEKPTIEKANVILTESWQEIFELNSFTTAGDAVFQIKNEETIIFEIGMRDTEKSIINPLDFANQGSSMVVTYNVRANLEIIADIIQEIIPPEELTQQDIEYLEMMREIGQVDISARMAIKSIGLDSYMKIVEIEGLREILTQFVGPFMAEEIMREIEPFLGVWKKTPGPDDPAAREEIVKMSEKMFEAIKEAISPFFEAYYVTEVLPNTEVNDIPVYNFVIGIDLDKVKNAIIHLMEFITREMMEMFPKERMLVGAGMFIENEMFAEEGILVGREEEIRKRIEEIWPVVEEIFAKAIEMNLETYICQETHFKIKDTVSVNLDLYELMVILSPIIIETVLGEKDITALKQERMALEEEIAELKEEIRILEEEMDPREEIWFLEFELRNLKIELTSLNMKIELPQILERIKEMIENMSVVVEWNFRYSQHNAVPPIVPPAEYELI
jgi:hypothetical protein